MALIFQFIYFFIIFFSFLFLQKNNNMLVVQNLEIDNKDTSYEMLYIVLLSACPSPWTLFETCLYILLYWLLKPIYPFKSRVKSLLPFAGIIRSSPYSPC